MKFRTSEPTRPFSPPLQSPRTASPVPLAGQPITAPRSSLWLRRLVHRQFEHGHRKEDLAELDRRFQLSSTAHGWQPPPMTPKENLRSWQKPLPTAPPPLSVTVPASSSHSGSLSEDSCFCENCWEMVTAVDESYSTNSSARNGRNAKRFTRSSGFRRTSSADERALSLSVDLAEAKERLMECLMDLKRQYDQLYEGSQSGSVISSNGKSRTFDLLISRIEGHYLTSKSAKDFCEIIPEIDAQLEQVVDQYKLPHLSASAINGHVARMPYDNTDRDPRAAETIPNPFARKLSISSTSSDSTHSTTSTIKPIKDSNRASMKQVEARRTVAVYQPVPEDFVLPIHTPSQAQNLSSAIGASIPRPSSAPILDMPTSKHPSRGSKRSQLGSFANSDDRPSSTTGMRAFQAVPPKPDATLPHPGSSRQINPSNIHSPFSADSSTLRDGSSQSPRTTTYTAASPHLRSPRSSPRSPLVISEKAQRSVSDSGPTAERLSVPDSTRHRRSLSSDTRGSHSASLSSPSGYNPSISYTTPSYQTHDFKPRTKKYTVEYYAFSDSNQHVRKISSEEASKILPGITNGSD